MFSMTRTAVGIAMAAGRRFGTVGGGAQHGMVGVMALEHMLYVLDELDKAEGKAAGGGGQTKKGQKKTKKAAAEGGAEGDREAAAFFDLQSIGKARVDSTYSVQLNTFAFHTVDRFHVADGPTPAERSDAELLQRILEQPGGTT